MKIGEKYKELFVISNLFDRNKWDKRYLELAKCVSTWSKDPSTQVGAICVLNGNILSTGYNGFPRGIIDKKERLENRDVKLSYVVHAEQNVIYNACFHGISLKNSSIYIYGLPVCSDCAKGIIQAGIKDVYIENKEYSNVWTESFSKSLSMFKETDIKVFALEV